MTPVVEPTESHLPEEYLATSDVDARRSRHDAVLMRIAHLRRLPLWRRRQLTISRRLSRG